MKYTGPIVTLAVGVAVAGGLLGASALVSNGQPTEVVQAADAATAPPVETAPGSPPPGTSPTAVPSSAPPAADPSSAPPAASSAPPKAAPKAVTRTYAGKLGQSALSIALKIGNGRAVVYVCDGAKIEIWLTGTAANGKYEATAPTGERVAGAYDAKTADGTYFATGTVLRFTVYPKAWPSWAPPVANR